MQITHKLRNVKEIYGKVLGKVTCKFQQMLNKNGKTVKNDAKDSKIYSKIYSSGKPKLISFQPTNLHANKLKVSWFQRNASRKPERDFITD